jgi:hypothetical protein
VNVKRAVLPLLGMSLHFAASAQSPAARTDFWDWLSQNIFKKVNVSGSQSFGLHMHEVEGDKESFQDQWYRGRDDVLTNDRYVSVSGRNVLGVLNFDLQFNNSPYAQPMDRRVSLNYDRGWLKADVGDITATLPGSNDLVRFSRTMRGAQVQTKFGNLTVKGLYTQSRSAARTISFTGNNTSGPYYLQGGYIVDGSLRVQVDGEEQRIGVDYTVNVYGGTITFTRPIPPTSTIVATFETLGRNQGKGDVYGGHIMYKVAPGVTIGASHIEQRPKNSGGLRTTTEEFQGYGSPNTPYFLLSPPMPGRPVTITVDQLLQVEGIDYFFDPNNPQIFYFTRFMPSTVIIRVTYTPAPDANSFGNGRRFVNGLDVTWQLAKNHSLTVSAARSVLDTPTGTREGIAESARYRLEHGRLTFDARWRNIPAEFVTVESTGFGRNDQGFDTKLNYRAGGGWSVTLQASNFDIGTPTFRKGEFEVIKGHNREIRLGALYDRQKGDQFYANLVHSDGAYNGLGNSTSGLNVGHRTTSGKWGFESGAGMTQVRAPKNGQQGQPLVTSDLIGGRFAATYRASDRLNLSAGLGVNSIRTVDKDGIGTDLSFKAEWRPSDNLSLDFIVANSNSGALTGINGFTGGSGFGYNGNGFSGGGSGFGYVNVGGRSNLAQMRVNWKPSSRFSIDAMVLKTFADGSSSANADMLQTSLLATWSPSQRTTITAHADFADVQFVSQPGSSQTTLFGLAWDHDFDHRWSFSGDYSFTNSGGTGISGFKRDMNSVFANLTYRIDKRQRVFSEFRSGRVIGYLPDRETYFGVGYSYDILPGIALKGTYKLRDRAASGTGGDASYRSRGFDIELEFRFGGR